MEDNTLSPQPQTISRLEKIFSETFHLDIPSPDTDLLDQGVLDSFQFVELLMQLEQEFGFRVDIDTIELDDLRTLTKIAGLVDAHCGKSNGLAVGGDYPA